MENRIKQAALYAFIAGICTFGSLLWMVIAAGGVAKPATFPNEARFTQAVFWFELATSGEEIVQVLGTRPRRQGKASGRQWTRRTGSTFFSWSVTRHFFATLFLLMYRLISGAGPGGAKALLFTGIALSVTMLIGDIFENAHPGCVHGALRSFENRRWHPPTAGVDQGEKRRPQCGGTFDRLRIPSSFQGQAGGNRACGILRGGRRCGNHRDIGTRPALPGRICGSIGMIGWLLALVHAGTVLFSREHTAS